jgi:hypothetical protein
VKLHHRIETEVVLTDSEMKRALGLHPKAYITAVSREERTWPRHHYVLVIRAQRHVHKRRGA